MQLHVFNLHIHSKYNIVDTKLSYKQSGSIQKLMFIDTQVQMNPDRLDLLTI